jgi:hypothetical protein
MQRQFSRVSVAGLKDGQYTALRPEQLRRQKNPDGSESGISARFDGFYVGFRIWVTGRPVFWREGHVPEYRIGQHELHSHLEMIALMFLDVCDNTLQ